jgi:hypothetical protein
MLFRTPYSCSKPAILAAGAADIRRIGHAGRWDTFGSMCCSQEKASGFAGGSAEY